MFLQHVRSVTSFCEVDASDPSLAHNRDAPNLQNKMCNGLGAWDVISQHVDFINGTNPPVPYPNDTVLNIKLAYQRSTAPASGSSHVVLVMDVSGSMSSRIFRLGQTASKFIYDIIPDHYHLGMSTFSSSGVRWRPIVTIANETVRSEEANGLPTSVGGGTSIGGGIYTALQMLRAEGDGVLEGSSLIVITDGQENMSPYIADIFNDVKSSGIIVHSMAYGRLASDNLLTLTDETGGIYEYYTESSISTALDGFLETLEAELPQVENVVLPSTLDRRLITLTVTDPVVSGSVMIDSSLGYQTEFFFTCPQNSNIKVNLTGPSSEYTPTSPEYSYDAVFKVIRIKLATSEPGNWTYQISRESGFANEVVAVWIRSRPRPKQFPITIKAYTNILQVTFPAITVFYVEVTKGRSPILEALVTAIAEGPSEDPVSVTLLDNGQGADTVRGDGIYSAYFTQFTGDGKYSVDVFVVDGGSASIVVNRKLPGGAYSILKPNPKPTLTRVDRFTRTGRAGGFVVTHYVPDDIIPPTRITDLLLSSFDFDNREVTLQWTAPGDDFDTGRADVFELRYGQSYVSLRTEFHNMTLLNDTFLLSGNMTPPLAGNKVTVTVRTPPFASSDVMVFGIRAIDEAGNVGDLSNLVAIARQPADEFDETGNFILDFGEPTNMRTTKEPDLQTTTEPDWQTTPAMGRANPSLDSLVLVYIHLISVCIIGGLTLVSGV